jgi:hypothetical protein
LSDGTLVRRTPDGKLVYADDGMPVKVEEETERVVDSRRTGVTISYSPEFADLEANTTLLKNLARITGGTVYSEEPKALNNLAGSGELYRPAPEGTRALLPLWYWLVFLAAAGLLFDVGVRRISLEPAEVRHAAERAWSRMRKKQEGRATAEEDAFLQRLRQKKAVVGENLEREKAGRKFEPTGPVATPPPPGADEGVPAGPAVFSPQPPPPPPTAKLAEEPADDYLSKLRQAKKRAPHEKDKDES